MKDRTFSLPILPTPDYGRPETKKPALHGRTFTPTPKFLGTANAYFVCHIYPKFQIFFDLYLHWVSVVRDSSETRNQFATLLENGYFLLLSCLEVMMSLQG